MSPNVHSHVCQHPIACLIISLHWSAPLYWRLCPAGEPPPRCGRYMLLWWEEYHPIRDKEKEAKKLSSEITKNRSLKRQTYIYIHLYKHICIHTDLLPQILWSVTSSCAVIVSTNSLYYFLTSYTNNSHVGTYTYSIYIICPYIHTYICTCMYGCEKERRHLLPQIAKHRE